MKNQIECYIIEDLLPEYIEDICSESTRQAVEEHLQDCEMCRGRLEEMKKMEEPEKAVALNLEGIQPFKKVEKELRSNRIKKGIAILLLVLICGVLGVLTVGQIFPSLPCPSYDSLMYRYQAKKIVQELVDGNIEEVLMGLTPNGINNPYADGLTHIRFFNDACQNLTQLYEKTFQDADVKVDLEGIIYEENTLWDYDSEYVGKLAPEGRYYAKFVLTVGGKPVHLTVSFENRDCYTIGIYQENENGYWIGDPWAVRAEEDSLEYNICSMHNWFTYYSSYCKGYGSSMESLVNSRGSFDKETAPGDDVNHEWFFQTMFGSHFAKACKKLGVADEETGCTEYATKVGNGMLELYNRCKISKFVMVNDGYNREERKYDAMLYWWITDSEGKECVVTKKFYFALDRYEAADQTEIIRPDDGFDSEVLEILDVIFDG